MEVPFAPSWKPHREKCLDSPCCWLGAFFPDPELYWYIPIVAVSHEGRCGNLTNYRGFAILYCMTHRPRRVFSLEQFYNEDWSADYELGTNTVYNTIWSLRNNLEPDPKHPTCIKAVFRVRYKIQKIPNILDILSMCPALIFYYILYFPVSNSTEYC